MANMKQLVERYFPLGMDSYTAPYALGNGEYVSSMNTICRGGPVQTRPGSSVMLQVPDGNLQGFTTFKPFNGVDTLVFAVDGVVYQSPFPHNTYTAIPNIKFAAFSKFVCFESCVQSADYDESGNLYWLAKPKPILMMQDGRTRAAYYDGSSSGHLNPTESDPEVDTEVGLDGPPIGLWMKWSNNRLWIARDDIIFAGDFANPLKATEKKYINEGRAFYLDAPCTGLAETPDQRGLLAFTSSSATLFLSSIADRTQWLQTTNFQSKVLQNVGCVSHRSIIQANGLLWWYSSRGLVSSDDATRANISSRIDIQDNEMMESKWNMSQSPDGICGFAYENFIGLSVPSGDKNNGHTWVRDMAPFEGNANAWASYWTGWRPIQWAKADISGDEHIYFASRDYDGHNRIWRAFTSDRTDNGCPITCFMLTKAYDFGTMDFKQFQYADIDLVEIYGNASIAVYVAGKRGPFRNIATKDIVATKGQVYHDEDYGYGGNNLRANRPQTRRISTRTNVSNNLCDGGGVEGGETGDRDTYFQLLFAWSGQLGIEAYRINAEIIEDNGFGKCEEDEVGDRSLSFTGYGALNRFADGSIVEYTSTQSYTATNPHTAETYTSSQTETSVISQADADNKALTKAQYAVRLQIF